MRSLLLLFVLVVAGTAADPSLTVVLDYEQPHSRSSFEAMQSELKSLLERAGLSLQLRDKATLAPNTEFGDLVIFKMAGRCDATPVPFAALSDERGPLAMAYTADGEILPFGEIRCDRIRLSLERTFGRGLPSEPNRLAYGSALAKVMAHEIYHMLARDARHTKTGLTKKALSSHELFESNSALPDRAISGITRGLNRLR